MQEKHLFPKCRVLLLQTPIGWEWSSGWLWLLQERGIEVVMFRDSGNMLEQEFGRHFLINWECTNLCAIGWNELGFAKTKYVLAIHKTKARERLRNAVKDYVARKCWCEEMFHC